MCLLAVIHKSHPDAPLIVAANRDEMLDRPAIAMTVLREAAPRIVGGRDELAGGTWLAINHHGVVAGLTNLPSPGGRDGSKRSRGELPLLLAGFESAKEAVEEFTRRISPRAYNPCWILAGDGRDLYYLDVTGDAVGVTALPPGVHVLENRPLDASSPKAAEVKLLVKDALSLRGEDLVRELSGILGSHDVPAGADDDPRRPRETYAPCVHAGPYGTRSSTIVIGDRILYTDGPPCVTPFRPFV